MPPGNKGIRRGHEPAQKKKMGSFLDPPSSNTTKLEYLLVYLVYKN